MTRKDWKIVMSYGLPLAPTAGVVLLLAGCGLNWMQVSGIGILTWVGFFMIVAASTD